MEPIIYGNVRHLERDADCISLTKYRLEEREFVVIDDVFESHIEFPPFRCSYFDLVQRLSVEGRFIVNQFRDAIIGFELSCPMSTDQLLTSSNESCRILGKGLLLANEILDRYLTNVRLTPWLV